jgi:glycosyltransferase involved in cell wall biosynthesis
MFDIDVARGIADVTLAPGDAGAAVLARRNGVPVAFWLEGANGRQTLPAAEVAQRILAEAGPKIVAECLREEIGDSAPREKTPPPVTVAICTRDRSDSVERLLRSLTDCVPPLQSHSMEILLVDNAPSDNRTRELAARWPMVRYMREVRPGLNFARNLALKEARGDILAFLDDDVIVDRSWWRGLVDAWFDNQDAAAFTGLVLPMELETDAQILFEQRGGFRRGFERIRYGRVLPGNRLYPGGAGIFGTGANMALRTQIVRELGGFDEALDTGAPVPGGGDLDIFYRVIRAGYPLVYEPRFLVFHQHRKELKALRFQYRRSWGYGFMCYMSKCLKSDPDRRTTLRRLVLWWFVNDLKGLLENAKRGLKGEPHLPVRIFVEEIAGAIGGLFGGYARSERRIEEIRARFRGSEAS